MTINLRDLVNRYHRGSSSSPDPADLRGSIPSSAQAQSSQRRQQQLLQGNSNASVTNLDCPDQSLPQAQHAQGSTGNTSGSMPTNPAQGQTSEQGLQAQGDSTSMSSTGQDETFKEIWGFIRDDKVGMVGIYGMGGVGKTTLMKRIANELEGTCYFDVVLWVVVSKDVNMNMIQKSILRRLKLPHCDENTENQEVIFEALHKKKFVLLFDDLWEHLDLQELGIPAPGHQKKSKVLFTTRSEDVCGRMQSQRKIKVNCLAWKEAWELFRENVGEEAFDAHFEISNLAQQVAIECRGLPLAVIVIGRAMTCKTTPQEWKHALTTLRNAPYEISGTGKDLYYRLKFSHDMLPNDAITNCFLYCSLFPEDYMINEEDLIKYWMEEGFLDDYETIDEAINKGYDVIGILKVSCLLESARYGDEESYGDEERYVKMHDVVRDMALWVASDCGANKVKFLVKAGIGLHKAPDAEKWRGAERISLMKNEITEFSLTPDCPKLLTLMLQHNIFELHISETFFQFMPLLQVLDLSSTGLGSLPASIGQLVMLQYLNLSGTHLEWLPKEIGDLRNLRRLDMSHMLRISTLPPEMFSRLSKLQVFEMMPSIFSMRCGESHEFNISLLESLEVLSDLSIPIQEFASLKYLISSHKLAHCLTNLRINLCREMNRLQLLSHFGSRLRKLRIDFCKSLEDIEIGGETEFDNCQILPSVEVLRIEHNHSLKRIHLGKSLGLCLRSLRKLHICQCWWLEDLEWVKYLPSLEYFLIWANVKMEELFSSQNEVQEGLNVFPKLKQLHIKESRKLKRICGDRITFPSLESLEVNDCHNLKKLPIGLLNVKNTLRRIEGKKGWWNSLEWLDDNIKSCFQPYFKAIDGE